MARQIKRYENRKLYDTEASAYVSLRDLAELVRSGETIEVLDNVTGEDITAQALTQVILEEGKRGRTPLTADMLHNVLRRSAEVLDTGVEQVRSGIDDLVHRSVRQMSELMNVPSSQDVERLRQRLDELDHAVSGLLETVQKRRPEERK